MSYEYLKSDCKSDGYCSSCKEPVKQGPNQQWFITMGHAGFNSPTNNRSGYKTKESAVKAHQKYAAKGKRHA